MSLDITGQPFGRTSRFETCLKFVLQHEGGFVDDPADRGGATNCGITQGTYDAWCVAHGMPHPSPVRDILADEVEAIYRANYWEAVRAHLLLEPLDLVMFDAAVQHGVKRAVRLLQQALPVEVDGVFGPATLYAVTNKPASLVAYNVMEARRKFYAQIIANDPVNAKFENGWNNRMQALRLAARLT